MGKLRGNSFEVFALIDGWDAKTCSWHWLMSPVPTGASRATCETSTTCNSTITKTEAGNVEAAKSEINDVIDKDKIRVQDISGGSKDSEIIDPDKTKGSSTGIRN